LGHGPENREKTPLKPRFLLINKGKYDINDAKKNANQGSPMALINGVKLKAVLKIPLMALIRGAKLKFSLSKIRV